MAFVFNERYGNLFLSILLFCAIAQFKYGNCQPTVVDKLQRSLNEAKYLSESGELMSETEMQTRNCHAMCGHCECMGFYCGEECICECNKMTKNDKMEAVIAENLNNTTIKMDTECLAIMQKNAKELNLPFELLIQGPNGNRIMRTALHLQQESNSNMTARNKRSTIVIYKPALELKRAKRGANDNLDWLSDFTNGLMRPAPKRSGRKAQNQLAPTPTVSTSAYKKSVSNNNSKNVKAKNWQAEADRTDSMINMRKSSKNTKPAALYKLSTNLSNNNKSNKKQQQSDHELFNESMDYDEYKSGKSIKSKQETRKNLIKPNVDEGEQDEDYKVSSRSPLKEIDTSVEHLAELLYMTPMKVLDKMPAAFRDAIRRIRQNESVSNKAKTLSKEDMRLKNIQEYNSEENDDSDEQVMDQQNFAEMLRDLHEQLMSTMEVPKSKGSKGKWGKEANASPRMNKIIFLQRLQEMMDNQ